MYDTLKTLIKIILLIIIVVVIFYYINSSDPKVHQENFTCDLENLNLDDLVIINRNQEYIKLINKLIDDKSFILTNEKKYIKKRIFNMVEDDIDRIDPEATKAVVLKTIKDYIDNILVKYNLK